MNKLIIGASALALVAGSAMGSAYNEIGDAADAIAGAPQTVSGSGVLDTISGATGAGDLTDAYVIRITDPANFWATTDVLSDSRASADFDTRLFLFDLAGNAVLGNDDSPASFTAQDFHSLLAGPTTWSSITGGGVVDPSASEIPAAGDYILAISGFSQEAQDSSGTDLFDFSLDFDALYGPDPASNGVLAQWEDTTFEATGNYTIALNGAEFIPTPGAAALFGIAGLAGIRRRRA